MAEQAVIEAFDALRERLATRGRWIQGSSAKTNKSRGRDVWSTDEKARCWCLQGAIEAVARGTEVEYQLAQSIIAVLPARDDWANPITVWNDEPTRTHKQVLELIDKARAHYLAEVGP